MDATVKLARMPAGEGIARVRLVVDEQGIHVYLGEREVWVEVSEEGNLIARCYFDRHTEDAHTTLTILHHKIVVGEEYTRPPKEEV